MVGIVFVQHLYQVRQESYNLERVAKKALQLSQEVTKLTEENSQHELQMQFYDNDSETLEDELNIRHQNLRSMEKKIDLLHEENEALDVEIYSLEKMAALGLFMSPSILMPYLMTGYADSKDELNGVTDSQLMSLEQKIGRNLVLQKFGQGPYHVMIEVAFPLNHIQAGTTDQFVVEMAPLKLMPYTVHYFLEQISQKLYDGTSFGCNPGHVIQTWPYPYIANVDVNMWAPFADSGMDKLAFQEYSHDYPHEKYTLGFASGSEFYISLEDNTVSHGPALESTITDPCFGKIVHGFKVLDRMRKIPVPCHDVTMEEYIGIKRATIIESYNPDDYEDST